MTGIEWVVIAVGVALVLTINMYFFGSRAAATGSSSGGVREVPIEVLGGYSPAVIRAKAGERVRLVFDRRETSSCSEELVLPDFGVRRFLPAHEKTVVEVTPERAGTYEFTCGMGMLRGRLEVES